MGITKNKICRRNVIADSGIGILVIRNGSSYNIWANRPNGR